MARELTRRNFLGLSAATAAIILTGCSDDDAATPPTTADAPSGAGPDDSAAAERVLIVGAGPAGMTAAHHLRQRGVDFQILEAAPTYGGRIKHDLTFTDFPIPLGAEWLHVAPDELDAIVGDSDVEVTTRLAEYKPDDQLGFFDGELALSGAGDVTDLKFVGSSWLDFFETYVVGGIEDRMVFDTQIVEVDYGGGGVTLTDAAGGTWDADRVIVTAPLKVVQRGDIGFVPALPESIQTTIDEAIVWSGMKVFLAFSEAFYPAYLSFPDSDTNEGQRIFYDAAYGQDTTSNVLGLFSVGRQAEEYQALTDDELLADILAELDEVFDGAASRSYIKHLAQNWNTEPFIGAAYLADVADLDTAFTLSQSIDDRLYFAGEAYVGDFDWGSVHSAARAARDVVAEIVG